MATGIPITLYTVGGFLLTAPLMSGQLFPPTVGPYKNCYNPDEAYLYSGKENTGASGRTCQRWDVKYPNKPHDLYLSDHVFLVDSSRSNASNYCRAFRREVDDAKYPWCYTTDPYQRWEWCDIPTCTDWSSTTTPSGISYDEESNHGAVIGVSIAVALLLIAGLVVGADRRRRKALGQRHITCVPELRPYSPRSMVYSVNQQGGASDRFHQSVREYRSASQSRNSSRPHAASDSQNQGYSKDAFIAPAQCEDDSVPVTVVDPLSPPSSDDIMPQSELKRCM